MNFTTGVDTIVGYFHSTSKAVYILRRLLLFKRLRPIIGPLYSKTTMVGRNLKVGLYSS